MKDLIGIDEMGTPLAIIEKAEVGTNNFNLMDFEGDKKPVAVALASNAVLETTHRTTLFEGGADDWRSALLIILMNDKVTFLTKAESSLTIYYNPTTGKRSPWCNNLALATALASDYQELAGFDHVKDRYKTLKAVVALYNTTVTDVRFDEREAGVFKGDTDERDDNGEIIKGIYVNKYNQASHPAGFPSAWLENLTDEEVALQDIFYRYILAYMNMLVDSSLVNEKDRAALQSQIESSFASYVQPNHYKRDSAIIMYGSTGGEGKTLLAFMFARMLGYNVSGVSLDKIMGGDKSVGWELALIIVINELEKQGEAAQNQWKNLVTEPSMDCDRKYGSQSNERLPANVMATTNNLSHVADGREERRDELLNADGVVDNVYPDDLTPRIVMNQAEVDLLFSLNGNGKLYMKRDRSELVAVDGGYLIPASFVGDMLAVKGMLSGKVYAVAAKRFSVKFDNKGVSSKGRIKTKALIESLNGIAHDDDMVAFIDALKLEKSNKIDLIALARGTGVELTQELRKYLTDNTVLEGYNYQIQGDSAYLVAENLESDAFNFIEAAPKYGLVENGVLTLNFEAVKGVLSSLGLDDLSTKRKFYTAFNGESNGEVSIKVKRDSGEVVIK